MSIFRDTFKQCLLIRVEETINHRVKKLVEIKTEGSVRAFARAAGVNHQTVHNIIDKSNYPGFEFLHKVLSIFNDISAEWLMMGDGNMYKGVSNASSHDIMQIEAFKTRVETLEILNSSLTERNNELKLTVDNLKSLLALNTENNKQLIKEKKKSK